MMACCVNPVRGTQKLGSIGIPLPDVEVRIVDAENATASSADEVGELLLRAPQRMSEYWNNPAETAQTLQAHGDGAPWLHTGDLAYMDDEGYVFLVDRKKDMIKTSGYQVWPREIEEVIAAHPAVHRGGVAGVPRRSKGEVAKAWVVLKPDARASEDELRAFCRERLAPYKVPGSVEFRTDLPKSMVGKVRPARRTSTELKAAHGVRHALIPAAANASRTRRASAAAPGVSPCRQMLSARNATRLPSAAVTLRSRTMATARAATTSASWMTLPGSVRGWRLPRVCSRDPQRSR